MDSYANWAEMRCGALIYTRVARDWREYRIELDSSVSEITRKEMQDAVHPAGLNEHENIY